MTPTAEEQLTLELINRLRADPDGEFARLTGPEILPEIQNALDFFGVDLSSLESSLGAFNSEAPLAWNGALALAASRHNDEMIAADTQSHQLPGEAGLGARLTDAGYTNWVAIGENIFAYARSAVHAHAAFTVDWGYDAEDFDSNGNRYSDWQTRGDGIQDPAGHLLNLMNPNFTEIGIAITAESDSSTDVGPLVITHDLGTRSNYSAQFLGVVIDDLDNDDFYDIGEGMGGVTVTLEGTSQTYTTTTWDSGGWQIAVPAGSYEITFSGGGLAGTIVVNATLGPENVKVDVEADEAASGGGGGGGAGDTITGSNSSETLVGTSGNDSIFGLGGHDTLEGRGGDDWLEGGNGNDILDGGVGIDTASYEDASGPITVNLNLARAQDTQGAGTDTFINIENLTGSVFGDTLFGSSGENTLNGGRGSDTLRGLAGDDEVLGGLGHDALFGGTQNDTLYGEGGNDRVYGNSGDDFVNGGVGNDNVFGGGGSDQVHGGNGQDIMNGHAGDDLLIGGPGVDLIVGGQGSDRFLFNEGHLGSGPSATDRIKDFSSAQGDVIDFRPIDADTTQSGNQAFDFIGEDTFSGTPGELRTEIISNTTYVYGDTDGDGNADISLKLTGQVALSEGDLIL